MVSKVVNCNHLWSSSSAGPLRVCMIRLLIIPTKRVVYFWTRYFRFLNTRSEKPGANILLIILCSVRLMTLVMFGMRPGVSKSLQDGLGSRGRSDKISSQAAGPRNTVYLGEHDQLFRTFHEGTGANRHRGHRGH